MDSSVSINYYINNHRKENNLTTIPKASSLYYKKANYMLAWSNLSLSVHQWLLDGELLFSYE